MTKFRSKLEGCIIVPREEDPGIFFIRDSEEGEVEILCNLDRYAVVPLEHYEELRTKAKLDGDWH